MTPFQPSGPGLPQGFFLRRQVESQKHRSHRFPRFAQILWATDAVLSPAEGELRERRAIINSKSQIVNNKGRNIPHIFPKLTAADTPCIEMRDDGGVKTHDLPCVPRSSSLVHRPCPHFLPQNRRFAEIMTFFQKISKKLSTFCPSQSPYLIEGPDRPPIAGFRDSWLKPPPEECRVLTSKQGSAASWVWSS